jgi:hypothetical protein
MGDLLSPEAEITRVARAAAAVLERGPDPRGPYHTCNSGGPPREGHPPIRQCTCGEFYAWSGYGWYLMTPAQRWRHRRQLTLDADLFYGNEDEADRWRWWHYFRYPVQAYYRWRSVHG